MRPNMKQKARMMFHEITEIPREKYNEGLSVRKFTHDLSMAHYMYLPHTSEDIDKIMGQVGVCFAMAWQDRQMPDGNQIEKRPTIVGCLKDCMKLAWKTYHGLLTDSSQPIAFRHCTFLLVENIFYGVGRSVETMLMHMALSSLNTSKPCMRLFSAESQHPVDKKSNGVTWLFSLQFHTMACRGWG